MTGIEACKEIMEQVNGVVEGKEDVIRKVLAAMIAGGSILIEDIPGVGKTTMAKAFSTAMKLDNKRIQFTMDVMPSDITGFTMFDKEKNKFVYRPGAVMCNLLLADEINRTTSKTQAALLEAMEEKKTTVDGKTRALPTPFLVIATQNPIGSVGTTMLPESQLDRFMFRLHMGYPDREHEVKMILNRQDQKNRESLIKPVIDTEGLCFIQKEVQQVFIHEQLVQYVIALMDATRHHPYLELGVSPRGSIALVKAAKAIAYIEGRDYVIPEDVKEIFYEAVNHRVILSPRAKVEGMGLKMILDDILRKITVDNRR